MRATSTGATTGIILATGTFLVCNRILYRDASIAGLARHDIELVAFFGVWGLSFLHAAIRERAAIAEQCAGIALFAFAAPVLNWITTPDNPVAAIATGTTTIVIMDVALFVFGSLALAIAIRIRNRSHRAEVLQAVSVEPACSSAPLAGN